MPKLTHLGSGLMLSWVLLNSVHADAPNPANVLPYWPATIMAFYSTDIFAKDSGFVRQIYHDIGDKLHEGDVLAVLDDPELNSQLEKAKAGDQQAQAALEVVHCQIKGLEAELGLMKASFHRVETLFAGQASTAQNLDEAKAKVNVAEANLLTGQAQYSAAEASLAVAHAELMRLQQLVKYDQIQAPFNGMITHRYINPGDLVQTSNGPRNIPLFTLEEIDKLRVVAFIPEGYALHVHKNTSVAITLSNGNGHTYHARITRTAQSLDPKTRTMRIEVELPNPKLLMLPGQYARLSLEEAP